MTKLFYEETEIEVDDSQRIIEINPDLSEEYFKVGDVIEDPYKEKRFIIWKVYFEHPKTYIKDGKLNVSYCLYSINLTRKETNILSHKSVIKLGYVKIGECKNV